MPTTTKAKRGAKRGKPASRRAAKSKPRPKARAAPAARPAARRAAPPRSAAAFHKERTHCIATDPFGDPCQTSPRYGSKYCSVHSHLDR